MRPQSLPLYNRISTLVEQARRAVVKNVNLAIVYTYCEIGRMIVEDEQRGGVRADYGKGGTQRPFQTFIPALWKGIFGGQSPELGMQLTQPNTICSSVAMKISPTSCVWLSQLHMQFSRICVRFFSPTENTRHCLVNQAAGSGGLRQSGTSD